MPAFVTTAHVLRAAARCEMEQRLLDRAARQSGRRSGRPRPWSIIGPAAAGAIAFAALSDFGRDARQSTPLVEQVAHAAQAIGLGLTQVNLTGHRHTPDREIFDTIDLPNVHSLLMFDGAAVKARIERLPWIRTASVSRVVPGQVDIQVTEREPAAVWRHLGREHLIDATGRVLAPIATGMAPALLRLEGDGAAAAAPKLLTLLGGHRAIAERLEAARRFADRRWTLRLAEGLVIHLPASGADRALRLLAGDGGRIFRQGLAEIDLRIDGRVTVRR